MKKKILLVNPPGTAKSLYGNIFGHLSPSFPPLGIAYIAAVLIDNGYNVVIQDYSLRNMIAQEVINDILNQKPNFLGITSTTSQYNVAKEIVNSVKERDPLIKTILGGSHFTALPIKSFNDIAGLDYGIVGEGEHPFRDLVNEISPKEINGLVFREKGDIFYKNDFAISKDLNKLPYPARFLLPLGEYIPSPVNYKRLPSTTMVTSRGCAGHCDFCVDGNRNHNVRLLSAERVFEEMRLIKERFGIEDITIKDDGFTQDRGRVFKICDMIIKKDLKIYWNCMSRVVDILDKEMLSIMKVAGCYQIGIGVEIFGTETLKNHNKAIKREMTVKAVELLKKVKIEPRLFLLIGFPEETREDILNTFRFAEMLKPEIFQMCVLLPFPGTKLRENYEKEYGFTDENWDSYLGFCPECAPALTPLISKEELIRLFYKGYSDFYSHPKRIIKNLVKTLGNRGLGRSINNIMKSAQFLYKIRGKTREQFIS